MGLQWQPQVSIKRKYKPLYILQKVKLYVTIYVRKLVGPPRDQPVDIITSSPLGLATKIRTFWGIFRASRDFQKTVRFVEIQRLWWNIFKVFCLFVTKSLKLRKVSPQAIVTKLFDAPYAPSLYRAAVLPLIQHSLLSVSSKWQAQQSLLIWLRLWRQQKAHQSHGIFTTGHPIF